ncbi:MAG: bifunctional diaminohydroxyphosphoribosylaminopyrimidine deaminase/5-amino-6-(5-phosphoribosylamino)uracil reductase RibD [Zoogloeaceae bacterium]|jgi:diaminohydroxyphosphoribosylaminopyrimidine deaminase/5-amino-6-(5-phosphoribosylamino)uracil reductase|nr:bifunctional diaminohydroxyphosphoribosylaminopyrimidine deaminase/5-amino-6-(5-phosphoribosylamino)uracil reductase RibD [Zoogloeaceae bacterium]
MNDFPDSTVFSAADHAHMTRALRLAENGRCTTTPNPRVGCVIAREGAIVGEGWHRRAGEPHAEILALAAAGEAARGATAYVTLEPCAHFGRTPPCADALMAAGLSRVVAAMEDPNPKVAGRGLEKLRMAGIEVDCGLLAEEARELNIGFISRMTRHRPWLRLKIAATLDGKTALKNGVSQWITGTEARADGHRWRARACAILTGIGTIKADDPQLTVRDCPCERQPLRILLDSRLEVSPSARMLQGAPALIVTAIARDDARARPFVESGHHVLSLPAPDGRIDLPALMRELAMRELNEIHVEAGATLNGALLAADYVDELLLYLAPMLVGDAARGMFHVPALTALDAATRFEIREYMKVGEDLRIVARPVQ